MSEPVLGVGIVGCGNIAGAYAGDLARYPEIGFHGVADMDQERARLLAGRHGVRAYPSVDDLLADPHIDIVVNLTTIHAHREVTTRALEAGKHVHSEKPLALTTEDGAALVELAEGKGLRLSCSPATFMGEAAQTVMKCVRDSRIGKVRVVYAEANWGRIESWHPNPQAFYEAGALFDVGVYPLTIATGTFGPARRVTAFGKVVMPDRKTLNCVPYTVTTPDFVTVLIELADDVVLRLTTNFYVTGSRQQGMEFHGDDGTLAISNWQDFNASVTHTPVGGEPAPVPYLREPYPGIEWGRAVLDLVGAIEEDRPHRATGRQAAHLVEILDATRRSYQTGRPVEVHSEFERPAPMDWAL